MDYEIRKIYKALGNFGSVEGIEEIKQDMDSLNTKINEYRNMYTLNSYNITSVMKEFDRYNTNLNTKYDVSFKGIHVPMKPQNIRSFGGIGTDHYEKQYEESMSKLGRLAVKKICDHYNIAINEATMAGTDAEVVEYFKNVLDVQIQDQIANKKAFKVSFED